MRKPLLTATTILSGILAMAALTSLQAAELKVIVGGSMTASMNAIAPQFEKPTATGWSAI
jgi:molybdate transport system substrate-binding protein